MPFSRYQIRNEFSLADPELYKAADKDDPEALLEGVAMAGLVGVLRQLGDLAEFAAEIFHDLHEEVMVTATRGHGLLVRVQQLESDFPSIERAFLSQTGHSAFFSSSGTGWHPNLRTEQNLITRGDLPRFVMDSYEECRGPPRLFLLDKFDVAGAGACLKRYTDPSFYKVEASSYEMMSAEAQRDKKIHKTKKNGSQWKNGKTPKVFQPSHVKLHQLLLEERIQNGASEPARLVKLKKRNSKFPFDMENGKGYMEKLLSSPPEDKLVHEVPTTGGPGLEAFEISMVDPPLGLPRQNRSPYESPSVDKTVSREHMDNVVENVPGSLVSELPTSSIRLEAGGVYSGMEEEVEEKHISVENGYQYNDVASEADDYVDALTTMESEIETDAELRANSDPSIKLETSSDTNVEQLQSKSSGSQSASDDECSSIGKKITSFSYSDTTSTSVDNMPPSVVDSPQAFACIEIPFRPRVSPNQESVNCIEVSDISSHKSATDTDLPVDQGAIFKETTSKDSDLSIMSSNNCVDVSSPLRTEQVPIDPEAIIASTSDLADVHSPAIDDPCKVDNEDHNSNSSLVISHVEEQSFGPSLEELDICDADVKSSPDACSLPKGQLTDDRLECKSDPAEARVSYSGDDETESKDRETVSVDSETKVATAAVYDPADDRDGDNNLPTLEAEKELKERKPESVNYETKDVTAAVSVHDDVDSDVSKGISACEDTELEGREVKLIDTETEAVIFAVPVPGAVEKNEDNVLSTSEVSGENGLVINELEYVQNSNVYVEKKELGEQSVILLELDSVPSAYCDHSNIQFLDSIQKSSPATCSMLNENDVDSQSAKKESIESSEKKESSEQSVISPELDSVPAASYDHTNIQYLDSIPTSSVVTCGDVNENDDGNPSANLKILQDESLFVIEKADQNGLHTDVLPDVDLQPGNQFLDSAAPNSPVSTEGQVGLLLDDVTTVSSSSKCDEQHVESESLNQVDHIEKLENASSILSNSVLIEEKVDQTHMQSFLQLESVDSQNIVDHETHDLHVEAHSEPYPVNHGLEQGEEFKGPVEPSMLDLPQLNSHINVSDQDGNPSAPVFSGYNMLPQLAPINLEEMPPLPPLPPMQWRMGKMQNASLISTADGGQHGINHFPSAFPEIASYPSLDRNEKAANEKAGHDYEDAESSSQVLPTESSLHTEEDGKLVISSEVKAVKFAEQIVPQPPFNSEQSQNVSTSGREIIWPSSTSSLPPADDVRPNGIRPMKVQRPRTPLIDAVAAHDKSKLRKVSERARPAIPKEEERDTLLEQIRAKSFNLKPAVQTRPSIQGPTTNLRVAAILEKANAIRQAFAGSDDDEDGDDGWSDS